jgi:hypothetical protein
VGWADAPQQRRCGRVSGDCTWLQSERISSEVPPSRAVEIGPAATSVIDELLAHHVLFLLRATQGVFDLANHDPARIEAACAKITTATDSLYRTIKGSSPPAPRPIPPPPARPVTPEPAHTGTGPRNCPSTSSPALRHRPRPRTQATTTATTAPSSAKDAS